MEAYFRSSSKAQLKVRRRQEAIGVALIVLGVLFFYSVLFPAGVWGRHIKGGLGYLFGWAKSLFPLWMAYVGYRIAISKPWPNYAFRLTLWGSVFFFFCTLSSLFGQAAYKLNYGGAVGLFGSNFLIRLLGVPGAWILTLIALGLTACGLLRLSPMEVFEKVSERLRKDIQEWRQTRQQKVVRKPPVVKPRPLVISTDSKSSAAVAPAPEKTESPAPRPVPASVPNIVPPTAEEPADVKKPVKVKAVKEEKSEPAPAPVPAAPPKPAYPGYQLPPAELLMDSKAQSVQQSESDLVAKAQLLEQTLANFGVTARATDIHPGPVITRFDLEPAPGVKISSIVNLADDIALAMKATRVRVLAPIPGKGAVGIEIPNPKSVTVTLKEIVESAPYQSSKSLLTFVLGKTTSGEPTVADLAPMPHLLVAGATGSGKSVFIHSLIMSILFRAAPDKVKFLLIDPKRLELPTYDGIPHLYDPRTKPEDAQVITQPKEAAKALARLVKVMEHRYEVFAKANVRNIEGFNEKRLAAGQPPEFYIVVIIDELADLMLVATREVEDAIQRLAQMARAVGIHLVLATQRPSVDVITGVIKANLPARVSFRVASQTDSRVILDTIGAESLVGSGDMLYLPAGAPAPIRLQGAFVSEKEVESVVNFTRKQGRPQYEDIFAALAMAEAEQEDASTRTELCEALRLVLERRRVSQDLLKSQFGSSARATNILSLLEVHGFIHKPEGTNRWEIYFDKIEDYLRAAESSNGE
ncbi:MAG TPA: DNA translocase FtsK 4TM domain-containing protein [Elusimicrobiota bacterium]|nr:DNA translocase FtsK 4TM domain-containing protein [Elusimicrobiota bacterium]